MPAPLIAAALACCLIASASAESASSKSELTAAFWQRDPDASFEDEGRMHCAPSAVCDGLIYLAQAFDLHDLVPGVDHDSQIKLVTELADDFDTDPSVGGTNPDKILTGLQTYADSKGYELDRLELKSWRGVSASNKEYKIGTKPDLAWMRSAARSEKTVEILNFGWYYQDGSAYKRKGGHWVAVVGAGKEGEFTVRNPLLPSERQTDESAIDLTALDGGFVATTDSGEMNMNGYFEGNGPGLPHGKTVKAILDAVIVFSLQDE